MNLSRYLCLTVALLFVPFTVSCAGMTDAPPETATEGSTPEERSEVIEILPVDTGAAGGGASDPSVYVSESSQTVLNESGIVSQGAPPDPSDGATTYVAVLWGEKRTGGYTLEVDSAELSGETVTVVLRLQEPPEGAIVSQALTYPYSVFGLSGVDSATTEFVFEDQDGERLDWPVEVV